ncbi:hypothetical protein H5410_022596 [Solanum commersonii]|uniref:Uncharacterized protein n=1 Tax=Solanum commersonii TaxID=4109 RepID=A0A9J5ZEG9_SOLCO|nr:hypothetical protein H5410_022596 [Solanum commersonii]
MCVSLPIEEVVVVSKAESSTMSKRLFAGDFPEGKGPKSNILAVAAELVVIQSLASLRGDVQPSLLEQELRKRVQGANALTVGVTDLETVKSVPDTNFDNEPAESAKERKIKRKDG